MDDSYQVQAALVALLKADPALNALVGARLFDVAPQDTAFPYCEFGDALGEPFDGVAMSGWESVVTLHTWSRAAGRGECLRVLAAINDAVHDRQLSLSSSNFVNGRLLSQRTIPNGDQETTHGIQQFRFVTGT